MKRHEWFLIFFCFLFFFFFKQQTAYEIRLSLVGSEMYISDRSATKEGGAGAACPMARCMNFKEEMRDDSGFVMGGTGPVVSGGIGGGITQNE